MGRRSKANNYDEHSFYCIKCGNKGIPLMRPQGHLREQFHRKKLYCPICQQVINHVECKTMEEVETFKMSFAEGAFVDEVLAWIPEEGVVLY